MLEIFVSTLNPMLVLFFCIVIGYFLKVKKLLPSNSAYVMSNLENKIFVPALVISTFMKYCTTASLKEKYVLIIYCIIALAISLVFSYLIAGKFAKTPMHNAIYKYAITFANFGFMGNSIALSLFGDEGLFSYMLFTLPLQFTVYSWGIAILTPKGEAQKSILSRLINPSVIGIVIGITLGLLNITKYVPVFVTTTISNLSSCMGPVAMLLTGFIIGEYNLKELILKKRVYVVSALRLIIIPTALILLLKLLGADSITLKFALVAFATPLGINTIVFPAAYGINTSTAASMAMISNVLGVITIPLLYTIFSVTSVF